MSLIHHRYTGTLLSVLNGLRERRAQFHRLLADRPTGVRVHTRTKHPSADLKRQTPKAYLVSGAVSAVLLAVGAGVFPEFEAAAPAVRQDPFVLNIESIPETRQVARPPLARPSVPIETVQEDVPEDVTIETTNLDLERAPVDVPPPPVFAGDAGAPPEEEVLEVWKVEQKPRMVKRVQPEYPREARVARVEGSVFLKLLVGKDGKVKDARVVKGQAIFHEAALEAAYEFVFEPAVQNDKPVQVWMMIPLQFRLVG